MIAGSTKLAVKKRSRRRKLSDDAVRSIRVDVRAVYLVAFDHGVSEACVYGVRSRRRKGLVPDTD
ncbi:hypothetical protein LCGC14_1180020 [marine sediment metagenome]|uniref:Uncharacterized protein n=1 Tax=marine sediment metagenome TaxID=412755 RepID=A0A0F9P5C4_9ZZZZ